MRDDLTEYGTKRLSGRVTDFDEERGLGSVQGEGGVTHPFHCTAIDDGSRKVRIGTRVTYEVVAGHLGRWEASRIRPIGDG